MSCVVTGGGRGVGRGIVESLLAHGWTVVVCDRDPGALSWVEGHARPTASRRWSVTPVTRASPGGPPTWRSASTR